MWEDKDDCLVLVCFFSFSCTFTKKPTNKIRYAEQKRSCAELENSSLCTHRFGGGLLRSTVGPFFNEEKSVCSYILCQQTEEDPSLNTTMPQCKTLLLATPINPPRGVAVVVDRGQPGKIYNTDHDQQVSEDKVHFSLLCMRMCRYNTVTMLTPLHLSINKTSWIQWSLTLIKV